MAYQVLALKYRPLRFEDVIAQAHITKTLARAVQTDRIANGYLFTGPRGTGKTTTARILAKALNCQKGPTPTPCNECSNCREIITGSSLDVLEIDAASNTGVDDVRTLRENIRYLPTTGKKRVFIIDEVHRLSPSAFDALLKTLEEPPDHAVFIFATTEPHKVPQTILSRTQRYDFRRVQARDLVAHLRKLADLEKVEIDDDALYLIARKGEGSVRDSLSLLDQMMALVDGAITRDVTAQTLGIVDRQFFSDLLDIISAGKTEPIFEKVKVLFDSGFDIKEFVNDFIEYLRNLLVQKSAEQPDRLLDIPPSEKEALIRQATLFTESDILRMTQVLSELLSQLKKGYDERIFLEICLVRLVKLESSITMQEVIERLNRLSQSAGSGRAPSPGGTLLDKPSAPPPGRPKRPKPDGADDDLRGSHHPPPPPENQEQPSPPTAVADDPGKPLNLPRVQMSWRKFLEVLKKKNTMIATMLAMGSLSSVTENLITIGFEPGREMNKQVVERPEKKAMIEKILTEYYGIAVTVSFIMEKAAPAEKKEVAQTVDDPAAPINTADLFDKDPELKRLVDDIDGEIIGRKKVD